MFFATRTFFRLANTSLLQRKGLPSAHRRDLLFCLLFFTLFPLVELLNAICFLLDEILFPDHRSVGIPQPIFVIGNPRSGTTILHRVLARDQQRFFCFRMWEIIFPSILQKKIVSSIGKFDRLTGSHLRQFMLRWEAKRFQKLRPAHKMGLLLPEEDDKLLAHILAAADLAFFFPYGGFEKLARFDVAVDLKEQRRIMDFYLQCVRRQAYFKGGRRTLLSKTPYSSGKVQNLLRCFPDCKIIYLVRNPLQVVPSAISVARVIIRSAFGTEPQADLDEHIYEALKFYYSYPLQRLARLPEDRFVVVNYEDLIRQPRQVVERIYERFGLPLKPDYKQLLDQEVASMRQYKSRHRYSLDQCSVTRERIVSDLGPIFERFEFDVGQMFAANCSCRP
jgi:hypothetical protein